MKQPLTVPAGTKVVLGDFDAGHIVGNWTKQKAAKQIAKNSATTIDLAYRLYAENQRSILIVLQGMDTSGKDGTIRTVMSGVNPQSCQVTSFKQPGDMELEHDFLWRIHLAAPRKGNIGIFNRSHYEDVLVVRVHKLVPDAVWRKRYDQINEFEALLADTGVKILKFFLHISKDEQRERLQARLANPDKRWKFSKADLAERKLWDEYERAYEDALTRCNTPHAPWHMVPANRKWYRNLVVSQTLRETLEKMNPKFPAAEEGIENVAIE